MIRLLKYALSGRPRHLHNLPAERNQRKLDQLEMLPGKGNADDRDAKQRGEKQMNAGCIQAAAKQPDNIEKGGQAPASMGHGHHFLTKRPKHQAG